LHCHLLTSCPALPVAFEERIREDDPVREQSRLLRIFNDGGFVDADEARQIVQLRRRRLPRRRARSLFPVGALLDRNRPRQRRGVYAPERVRDGPGGVDEIPLHCHLLTSCPALPVAFEERIREDDPVREQSRLLRIFNDGGFVDADEARQIVQLRRRRLPTTLRAGLPQRPRPRALVGSRLGLLRPRRGAVGESRDEVARWELVAQHEGVDGVHSGDHVEHDVAAAVSESIGDLPDEQSPDAAQDDEEEADPFAVDEAPDDVNAP